MRMLLFIRQRRKGETALLFTNNRETENGMLREKRDIINIKNENRNRIFRTIRQQKTVSRQGLVYELDLSLPTVTQNICELMERGLVCENGSFGHTGGRRARAYSIVSQAKCAVGLDITKNHIALVVADLNGEIISDKRLRVAFSKNKEYFQYLGEMVKEAVSSLSLNDDQILGVGIAVPGLITQDNKRIFYGKILDFEGLTSDVFSSYFPYPCKLLNDADAAGFAEMCQSPKFSDAFYISLSNNIGGSVLIDHKVYKGEGPRSGEVGHMTIVPNGRECYCGQRGCFETYCNAALLSDICDGNLEQFFDKLSKHDKGCLEIWEEYLSYLSIAVNNVRMLFDCKVILGGYVGAYIDPYMDHLKKLAGERNCFEPGADYLLPCVVKKEALASGAALSFIIDFIHQV